MNIERKIITGVLILSIFVFIVAFSSLYVQTQIETGNVCGCLIPLPLFIPFLAAVGMFIGTLIFHLFSPSMKKEKINKEPLMMLLDVNEREVVKKIIENKGKISQARLVNETNLSKVQVFRALEKMKSKNIVAKNPKGKTNIIEMNDDIYKIFS